MIDVQLSCRTQGARDDVSCGGRAACKAALRARLLVGQPVATTPLISAARCADGYLSADERMQEQDTSEAESDGDALERDRGRVVDFALLKAANQNAVLDARATSYFNALLAAKQQGQPVIICRSAGARSVLADATCTCVTTMCVRWITSICDAVSEKLEAVAASRIIHVE